MLKSLIAHKDKIVTEADAIALPGIGSYYAKEIVKAINKGNSSSSSSNKSSIVQDYFFKKNEHDINIFNAFFPFLPISKFFGEKAEKSGIL